MTEKTARINGLEIPAASGVTILEAARDHGINIPTLCHYGQGTALGACGICVVENRADGRLVLACSTPLEPGLDIRTESRACVDARRKALTRLVQSGQHNCFVVQPPAREWNDYQEGVMSGPWHQEICPAWGHCELQDLLVRYGHDPITMDAAESDYPLDDSHPMFVRDYSRCIRCGRCIQACNDVQVNLAIPLPAGWTEDGPPEGAYPLVDYDACVHCGECVQACPTGALFEKKAFPSGSGNDETRVRTTCPYCGVGCQMWLHVREERIVRVTGVEGARPNQGRLCVKGRFGYDFIYSEERLQTPLIREAHGFRSASWDEALDLAAAKIREAKGRYGPDSLAGVSCARSINEDSYQMQKLFRAVIGTNNIDHCART